MVEANISKTTITLIFDNSSEFFRVKRILDKRNLCFEIRDLEITINSNLLTWKLLEEICDATRAVVFI